MTKIISKRGRHPDRFLPKLRLKRAEVDEIRKCAIDPIYFMENYIFFQHPINGLIKQPLDQHQIDYVTTINKVQNVIAMMPRQIDVTGQSMAFLLWEALFKTDQRIIACGINVSQARHMCDILKTIVTQLPSFLKPAIKVLRRTEIVFDNGSSIHTYFMTPGVLKGRTFTRLYLDCFALAPDHIQKDMWLTFAPSIPHGGRVLMASTPHGKSNSFALLWAEANKPLSVFVPFKRTVDDLPFSDSWKQQMRTQVGELVWRRDYLCEFV